MRQSVEARSSESLHAGVMRLLMAGQTQAAYMYLVLIYDRVVSLSGYCFNDLSIYQSIRPNTTCDEPL